MNDTLGAPSSLRRRLRYSAVPMMYGLWKSSTQCSHGGKILLSSLVHGFSSTQSPRFICFPTHPPRPGSFKIPPSVSCNRTDRVCPAPLRVFRTMENLSDAKTQDLIIKEVEATLGSSLGTGPQAPSKKPLVIVISGPSGVGKDAVINRLRQERKEIHFVVTATTRPKRPGEIDGKDYFFLSKKQFESMIGNEELLEYAIVYGDFKGIPKQQVRECLAKGFDVVLRVDVQGAATIRSILGNNAVFIFLVAESETALVKRLVERKTESRDKLLVRIGTAREELKRMEEFDYVVINADGQLEKTVALISHIIDAEKARVNQKEAVL